MPNGVSSILNQTVRGAFSPVEINGAGRPFVGVNINNVGANDVHLYGVTYNIYCSDQADYPKISAGILNIQRDLEVDPSTEVAEDVNAIIVYQLFRDPFARIETFSKPLILASGRKYAIALSILREPLAVFNNAASLFLTVLGEQAPLRGGPRARQI